jgi:hypothetical protein
MRFSVQPIEHRPDQQIQQEKERELIEADGELRRPDASQCQ